MATEFLDKTGLTYLWGKLKSQFAPKVHDHKADEIKPIASKTYTGVIASANNFGNGTFYFGTVMPNDFYGTWGLRYRVEVWAAGESQAHALADLYLFGTKDALQATSSWNIIENTTYYPAYNNSVYRAKEAGINAGYGHALGVRIYSSWNPTTAANARTIKVDILECINCSFSFYANDAIYKYSQIPGTGSTNYSANTDINFTAQGLQETGDSNSTEPSNVKYYNTLLAKSAIVANTIVVGDSSGYQGIASGVTFDITYPILWCTTAIALNGTNYNNIYTQVYDRNLNTIGTFTFTAKKMVYLVVTVSGLTATVDGTLLTDTLPDYDDGKVYIAMGRMGNQSTGTNYFFFQTDHPMFQFKNGALRGYTIDFYQKPSGGIPSSDMASAVQTSLGKADSAYQKPSGGIPKTDLVSAVQTSLGKADTAYQKPSGGIPSTDLAESYYLASNPNGYTSNAGTITGVSANGTSVATSGVANIPAASTSAYGVTKLSDSTSTTSSVLAATPTAVKAAYDLANGKYSKPSTGIPKTDLASAVQTSLGKADTAYQKPSGGIPGTDLATAYAPLASPALTGTPTAPTASAGTNTTQIATTAFVKTATDGFYKQPFYQAGTNDIAMRPLVDYTRANRLAFLPADQIIIEKTTDGGTTWEDAGVSDISKRYLFSTRSGNVVIPLLNGAKSTLCGVRVTITGMKYNVPDNTPETQKYNYWSSTYVKSNERYCSLREMWFWVSANNDTIRVEVKRATGANPNTWKDTFTTDFGMTGWSGSDWIRFTSGFTFGGGTNQTSNDWNWRIFFWSRIPDGKTEFQSATAQSIVGINAYGESVWVSPNGLMEKDHLYRWDADMNATFPAKVTATGGFAGNVTGNVTGNVSGTAANVTGTVAVANGGTGQTTARNAANAFLNALDTGASNPVDADYYISQYVNGGTTTTTYHRRPMSALWNYIKSKITGTVVTDALGYTPYQKPSGGIPSTDMASAVTTSLGKADTAYQKPSGGIPKTDLASAVQTSLGKADSAYQKPSTGIPSTDMASAVTTSLGKADTAYQKPSTGIPKTDLASAVQTSLGKADSSYQKPSTGIPSTDLAESYYLASNPSGYTSNTGTITGVSANGTSVATSGVANIPAASTSAYGVTKLSDSTSTTSSVLAATPTAVKAAYDLANGKYSKPSGGIPKTDLASAVQTSLGKADSAYQKPSGGIPGSDLATSYAPLASPALTGTPTAPTAASGTNTTQIATTAFVSSAVGAIHNGIGRNILDNWYFVNPVNQRGQSSYSTSGAYTIDRWKLTSGSVTVGQGGIVLNGTITQTLENSIGVSVVASALLSNGTMITPTYNDTTKVFTLTATGQTIVAAKLEVGTKQTLAEGGQLTEIPDYYDQLTRCQRYFFRMHLDAWQLMAFGVCSAARNIAFTIPFPRMHAAPTMSSPYTIDMWSSGGAWVQAQSFTVKYAEGSPNLSFDVYPNSNATVGIAYSPVIQSGGYIDFDADL